MSEKGIMLRRHWAFRKL